MFSKNLTSELTTDNQVEYPIKPSSPSQANREPGTLVVGQGVVLTGNLEVPDNTVVAGSLNGELQTKRLTVAPTGVISGKISCEQADISGAVGEDLTASDMLILRSSANIKGNIFYKEMQIERGAKVAGQLIML